MAKRNKETPERKKRQSARVPKLESLGKYQIQKEIGAGGMGAVFLARDTTLNRLAALKVLPRDKAENPVLVKRFKAEGQAAAHLRHENIVSVYDAGEEDGYLYIALEYVEGTDLHNLISKRNRVPVRRSLEIITQVTKALAHAYQQGIVHRDIKPANILIRQDSVVKLTDLGLARSIDDNTETSITRAGTTVGTVDYMAPEQARDSKAADIRSDIYSLGCTWYHMLTGRAPFSEGSLTNKLAAHASTPPPDPRELNDRVPEGIVAIIQRMMAKSQNDRYQNPEELLEDLKNSNLKRSNVDNNVLEALASDESDSEQATLETITNQKADSSDFLINQFMPDYSSPAETTEEETSNRLSTSFDLEQLAAEVEVESETLVPKVKRSQKRPKKTVEPEPIADETTEFSRTQDSAPPIQEGSVISDSAVKARETARSKKQETPVKQQKRSKPVAQNPKKSRKESVAPSRPQKPSRKRGPVAPNNTSASENGVAVDYTQIAKLIGGVILLILLIWWGIKTFSSSAPTPQGKGNNPFASADQNQQQQQANSDSSETQSPDENSDQTKSADDGSNQQPVDVSENNNSAEKSQATDSNHKTNEKWQNVAARGQEKKYLPEWGTGFISLGAANGSKAYPNLPVLKVAKGKSETGIYQSLNSAIQAVNSKGAVIRLLGQGPFLLKPHRLQNISELILMADSEQNPVVVIQADEVTQKQPELNVISFSGGVLRLQGIHFLCDVSQFPDSGTCDIFKIDQSDITFQNCSFGLIGANQKRTFRLVNSIGKIRSTTARPQGETRILLENSVITGSQLEAIHVNQPYADVLVSNCFISTKGSPCLELTSQEIKPKSSSDLEARNVPCIFRIFSSTLLSDRSIFELNGPIESKKSNQPGQDATAKISPSRTDIIVVNSVLMGNPKEKQSSMVSLIDWPQDKLRAQNKSRFSGLKFQLESTLLWGWPLYLKSIDSSNTHKTFQIDSHRIWQQSWGGVVLEDAFNNQIPSKMGQLRTPAFVKSLLDFSKEKSVYAISEGGLIAGCDPAKLTSLSQGQLKRISAYQHRPQNYDQLRKVFTKAKTVTFDMTKGDLSEFLKSSGISGPTNVLVNGEGICYTSPIILENKQVRLQFQQKAGGSPLVVQLKLSPSATPKRSRDKKSTAISSFITSRNSTLEMVGGNFQIAAERRGVIPKHFLICQNSRVALDQCVLKAMLFNEKRFQSVVYVEPAATKQTSQVMIDRSFLTASGTIIESRALRLSLEIQNSLLLGLQNLFAFDAPGSDSPSIQVSLKQSTFAPGRSVFTFQESLGTSAGIGSLQIFADDSIFMPAPSTSAVRADLSRTVSLFAIPPSLQKKKLIQWWGNSNGFMIERLNLLADSGNNSQTTSAAFSKGMKNLFGEEVTQRPLASPGGIILQEQKLPPLVKIMSSDFQLLPTCKAATWSELKQPIGAKLSELEQNLKESSNSRSKPGRNKLAF
ncbi:serine/threonine protein kinase [Gimesia aquarii]|uniref:non-specific serine/threonine protein kinase n=1 Tax=Gimesia aquarii TaxID=2527964 RepID=A0A517VXM2_9PLAN|nr:serine/threonine-protein kinase [Gimesia aquarii]QDT97749.1 Serine/threonine-protein kinase PrkC [Gimesia aquarii]